MSLKLCNIVIIDCQTNGSAPAASQMIELGWMNCSAMFRPAEPSSAFIGLRADQKVPGRILALTGISREELAAAESEENVLARFAASLPDNPVLVAHYARFEQGFLSSWLTEKGSMPFLCTFEIARRLFPDLPSRSIRAVSGYLGHHIDEAKRSVHHIEATYFIWQKLIDELDARGILSLQDLITFAASPVPKSAKKRYALSSEIRLKLPDKPGIYKMLGHDGRVLYVGKATSLRSRVNSYFRGQKTKGSRLNELVAQIASVDFQLAGCPMEAALVESDAIKNLNPPYNRAQKAGNRSIGYSTFDLCPRESPNDSDKKLVGPFSSMKHLEFLHELKEMIEALPTDAAPENELKINQLSDLGAEAEIIRQGLVLYRQNHVQLRDGKIDWRRTLCKSWVDSVHKAYERRRLALENDADEDESDSVEAATPEDDFVWHAEDIADYVAGSFAGYARGVQRARWLNNLANCELRWSDKDGVSIRSMTVCEGRYYFTDAPTCDGVADPVAISDLATYDRMQVLATELRRLLREGRSIELRLATGRILRTNQIKAYVFPGDFLPEEDAPT